jgi:dTMP kinase
VFVVFEGIDGAGTTTQSQRYAAHLKAKKRLVHVTREPSNGPIGSMIRLALTHRLTIPTAAQAETMALLFAADRLDHIEAEVAPHLRDGYVVISDRYDLSSVAYQSVAAQGFSSSESVPPARRSTIPPSSRGSEPFDLVPWIRELNRFALRPTITAVVHVSPDKAAARRRQRGGAVELFEDADLQARLAKAYRRAEELVPGDRIVHIDGDGSVDDVTESIIAALDPIVGVG